MSTNKFLTLVNGVQRLVTAVIQSSGVNDGGKIAQLDPTTGRFHQSLLPSGIGAAIEVMTASEELSAGDFVNIWNDSGTRKARKADSSNGREANGFTLAAVAANSNASVILQGLNTGVTTAIGTKYYLGANGGIVTTPPSTVNHIVQNLGFATSASSLFFEYNEPIVIGD